MKEVVLFLIFVGTVLYLIFKSDIDFETGKPNKRKEQ